MANEIKKYLDTAALTTLVSQIKAEDSKVLQGAKDYADGLASNYDAKGAATTAEANAKAYTDTLANGQVKTNKEDIAKLNGDATIEGSVAKKIADAKVIIDADINAVEAIANQNKTDIAAINNETTGVLAQAKTYADDKAAEVQGNVDTLSETVADLAEFVGDIPEEYTEETVVAYINKKAEETLAAAQGGSSETAASVKQQLDNYKSENNTKVNKNIENIAALQTALAEEVERADTAEKANAAAIKTISDDYLKAADKKELQDNIDTVSGAVERLTNGVSAEEVDGVNDLIQYVKDHGAEVTGMQEDIGENATAIAGVADRMDTAEGKITTLEGAVATKAEKDYVDGAIETLEGADEDLSERIATLEGKFGGADGSVEDLITDAQDAAIAEAGSMDAALETKITTAYKKYTDDEIDIVEGTIATLTETVNGKAAQSEVNTISGKVGTLETDMAQAKLDIDAAEALAAANKAAHEANAKAIELKASQADLEAAVARIATNEDAISTINTTLADKAEQDDLDALVTRVTTAEGNITSNTSAINSFTAITSDEVNALFA